METQQPAEGHDDPQIERRLVGIGRPVLEHAPEMPVPQRFIGNLQVFQLVGRGDFPAQQERQQEQQIESQPHALVFQQPDQA